MNLILKVFFPGFEGGFGGQSQRLHSSCFFQLKLFIPFLSAEHRTSGVSRAPPAVHGAPAVGGLEVEQAWGPNPGYR